MRSMVTCNNMEAVLAAALDGHGLAYMPDFLVRRAIQEGRLQALLDDCVTDHGQFWAVWPASRHLLPRTRVFVDFIADRLFSADEQSLQKPMKGLRKKGVQRQSI